LGVGIPSRYLQGVKNGIRIDRFETGTDKFDVELELTKWN